VKKLNLYVVGIVWLITTIPAYAQLSAPKKEIKLFFEKVYLHTDRQFYGAGDDIWFKAYLINAQDNRPINTSKNLYAELISPENKIVTRLIITLNNGLGHGDFQLAEGVPPGNYILRAYTNWMRNFGNNFIFEKSITVVDPKAAPAGANSAKTLPEVAVQYYPEGGSLVEGVSSLIAVKAERKDGRALSLKGSVFSTAGDTVARFSTDSLGMGVFTLLPLPGQTYQAKVRYADKTMLAKLPVALSNGLTLKIYKKDADNYAVVSCNEAALATYSPQTLTLKARTYGKVTFQQTLQLSASSKAVLIPTGQLPAGITSITLYDGEQKPNCERLMYVENPQKASVSLSLNKTVYGPREPVTVEVKATDKQGQPLNASFSLSAVDATLIPPEESNITAYMLLQSELKGEVKHAALYFDTTNVQRLKQLDQLLLTQGWRDFLWKRLADTALRIAYIPEQGISISGKVQDKKSGNVTGANITLIAPHASNSRLFSAQTNTQGLYFFDNLQLYGPQSVRLNSKDVKGKPLGLISLDSLSANSPAINSTPINSSTDNSISAASKTALIKQSGLAKQRSLSDTLIRLKDVEVTRQKQQVLRDQVVTGFGYKDEILTVKPEDYRYNTLRDYIQFASKQARVDIDNRLYFVADGGKIRPRIILNNRDAMFSDNDPDDVIDVISNSYFDLPVTSVEKVVIKKVIGGPSLVVANAEGSAAVAAAGRASGATISSSSLKPVFLIYLTLKPDAFKKTEPGAIQAEVNGYYEARTFYKPMYNQAKTDNRIDARPTLHWEPNGSTVQNGKSIISYYNSDSKTTVRVVVQGITTTGIPFTAVKTYNVK
jgi:hypothetical protein